MFRFANPQYLYLLLLIAVFAICHYAALYRRKKRIERYGDPALVKQLFVDVSWFRPELKLWLSLMAFGMFVLALARPQNGTKQSEHERYGIEAMVALDVSNSMLAQDVHPSRLDKSKRLVENMMGTMTNDQIGLIIFAGDAFIQLPITSDFISAKMFLDQINPGMISLQGTDVALAIRLAMQSFTKRDDVNRAIFIITDGEDNEGGAVEAAKEAAKKGIHVYVLGVGSPDGAHIPIPGTTQYMIDENGEYVNSKLNETMCREIAEAGKGAYIYVDNSSSAQEALNKHIDQLEKTKLANISFSEYNEKYQIFLIMGLVLLVIEALILSRENHIFSKINLFKGRNFVWIVLLAGAMASCADGSERDYLRRGNRDYRKAEANDTVYIEKDTASIDKALVEYEKSLVADSTYARAHYNKGKALMAQGRDSLALEEFKRSAEMERDTLLQSQSFHNMGVLLQADKQFDKAIACYKEVLRRNPHDEEARYNLALCQHQLDKNGNGGGNDQDENGDQQQQDQNGQNDSEQQNQQDQPQQQQPQQQDQKQEEQRQSEISKEAAEQMLNAAMQNERQTQDRLNRYNQKRDEQERNPERRKLQKNW